MTVPVAELLSFSVRKDSYKVPKYPIVLCHGFSGFDYMFSLPVFAPPPPMTDSFKSLFQKKIDGSKITSSASSDAMGVDNKSVAEQGKFLFEYWNGVRENLNNNGCTVLVAKVPPFGSIENRAIVLDEYIRSCIPKLRQEHHIPKNDPVKINLVAHSMGGLDCRYLIHQQKNGLQFFNSYERDHNYEVVSLTTISTPHRGTAAADFAMEYSPSSLIRSYFPSVFQLTTTYMEKFNNIITDAPDVKYFSYAAQFRPLPGSMFLITWKIVFDKEGENDGLVSLKSAHWGKYMGYLDDVDHADLINWMGLIKKAKMALGVPNFNPEYFYLGVADNLAKNGL